METTLQCQPSNADTNQFLLIVIRLLAVVGFSYLLRCLYQLIISTLYSHRAPPSTTDSAAEANIGLNTNDTAPASPVSLELDFDSYDGRDLGIRIPEPAYHPRGRL